MKIRTALIAAIVGFGLLGVARSSTADPLPSRTFRLYVAPLGPSIEGILDQLKPLIQEAGRQVTDVKEIQRINIGKLTGVEVTHAFVHPTTIAKWHAQDIYVAPLFGNAFNEAWQAVRFQKMANHALLDVEIIQQINIGKVTGLRLYFVDP